MKTKNKNKSSINITKINKLIPIMPNISPIICSIPRELFIPKNLDKQTSLFTNEMEHTIESLVNNNLGNNQQINHIDFLATSLFPIDKEAPEIEVAKKIIMSKEKLHPIFDLARKTSIPLSDFYENHLEEMSFIKIFPFGINGFKQARDNKMTAAAYGKSRIMSADTRYQNNDYMFYLLAKIETERITASINVCSSKLRTTAKGRVNDLNIYMKTLRGYSSYWQAVKADLMAFLRNLGEPTWFITLSARDLEWPDMINALLYANNKNNNNSKRAMKKFISQVSEISFVDRSKLLHDYPVVAARQFNKRFRALMKYLLKNNEILGGKVQDYWFRVEFQKRGSPHIHMLVWIKDAPKFNSPEGVKFLDNICKVSIPTDDKLKELVLRLQKHKCTSTCYKSSGKENIKNKCRFGYKIAASTETRILNLEELLSNNGKFCIFKRSIEEQSINVYNLQLLILWNAKMDIQPVGSLYGIAY